VTAMPMCRTRMGRMVGLPDISLVLRCTERDGLMPKWRRGHPKSGSQDAGTVDARNAPACSVL